LSIINDKSIFKLFKNLVNGLLAKSQLQLLKHECKMVRRDWYFDFGIFKNDETLYSKGFHFIFGILVW
jgi:hypothetical protein